MARSYYLLQLSMAIARPASNRERMRHIVYALYGSLQYVDAGICIVQVSQCIKEDL